MPRYAYTTVIASTLWVLYGSYGIVQAYVAPLHKQRHVKPKIPMAHNMKTEKNAQKLASSFIIGAFLSANTMCADPAFAFNPSESTYNSFEPTSSICVSGTITTMDFSLPSSYDKISDATASATAELTVETNVITNTSRKKTSTPAKSKGDSSSPFSFGGGGNSLTDEEKAEIAAARKAERDALAAEKEAEKAAIAAEKAAERELLAAQKAAEREELAQQKAVENEARLAEQAKKRALAASAKALAEEKKEAKAASEKLRGAEFVDFSLPSYGESASTDGKRDSVFAL
eukprot:CAMPEP_0204615888 /NCGR_PEP_ID=MMETSP0717-20131115/3264_1 /ASSEMBLY_ACC=CAM_ASM_000666 /TAXON_ID=230516 /ORGANISM="Chaetoceros curvisetus" /LENGTH=287 /DNA_ID=CAMNT_0051628935 /DNA_START=196 /DNA_END=1059 /DNA_ORIENTATION=-